MTLYYGHCIFHPFVKKFYLKSPLYDAEFMFICCNKALQNKQGAPGNPPR